MYLFIYLFIDIYSFIHPSIHSFMYLSTYSFVIVLIFLLISLTCLSHVATDVFHSLKNKGKTNKKHFFIFWDTRGWDKKTQKKHMLFIHFSFIFQAVADTCISAEGLKMIMIKMIIILILIMIILII